VNIHHDVYVVDAGLVTRCDVAEVAEALDVLLCDAQRRQSMGAAGRALVQRKWTWDVVASDLLVEYEKVIKRAKAKKRALQA
jgi:glycosyltransferase involved in cell wall biosynthesis